jgi:hypothetical protein
LSDLRKLTYHLPGKKIMTFSKSNLNLLSESLFTELTPDQAQMLEGGRRIDIVRVRCIKAGNGFDRLSFTVNGKKVGGTFNMQAGSSASFVGGANFEGTARVRLFDQNDGSVGSFNASTLGSTSRTVSGNGSTYEVMYQVSP